MKKLFILILIIIGLIAPQYSRAAWDITDPGEDSVLWWDDSDTGNELQFRALSEFVLKTDVDDTPVNSATDVPVSSNWAYDHVAAADPHTGYVLESVLNADNTTFNVSTSNHGLAPKLSNDAATWLDGTGAYSAPTADEVGAVAITTKIDDFGEPDDNTDLNVSTSAHGLAPKLSNDAATWLDGTGAYSAPTAAEVGALALTGGTLTGNLTADDGSGASPLYTVVNENDEYGQLFIGADDIVYFQSSSTAGFAFYLNGVLKLLIDNDLITGDFTFDDDDDIYTATTLSGALTELADETNGGVPNSAEAKVHWSQILGMPGDFADGSDATGSITGFYVFNSLTGGTADDLDSLEIDADSLAAGYLAFVGDISSGTGYFYQLIEDTDAEVEPYFIRPDDYDTAATKMVWQLLTGIGLHPTATPTITLKDSDAQNAAGTYDDHFQLKVNCTTTTEGSEDCDVEIWQHVDGTSTLAMRFDADGVIETSKAIAGGVNVKSESDATYTVGTDNALESYGTIFVNGDNDAIAFTLDTAVIGKNMCFKQGTGVSGAITVTAGAGDRLKQEDGTALTVATAYASSGDAGDWLCIYAEDDTYWQISRESGEWGE